MMDAVNIVGTQWRITILVTTTIPRGHHIVTTTIGATKGILMDRGMSPLVVGLSPMIIVQFHHDHLP
jgi:hypothetical protein